MKTKILFFIFTLLSVSLLALVNVSSVKAKPCFGQCPGGQCDVCNNVNGECMECGERGGEIKGECARASQCGPECCNGGQCGPCGGETVTCALGWHDNGRCVVGQPLNPPCCSRDATCPAAGTCPTCGPMTTVPNGSCGTITCSAKACTTSRPTAGPTARSTAGPGLSSYALVGAYNDPTNNCVPPQNRVEPIRGPYSYGWSATDPDYFKTVGLRCNGGACTLSALTFRERGAGFSQIRISDNSTISLTNFPVGYRCSDGPGCTGCSQSGVYGDEIDFAPNVTFYITKSGASPSPTPPPVINSWWQVKDGDVTTNSDITSNVPAASYFNTVGLGGFPGVPVYGGNLTTGSGTTSATRWNANTTTSLTRIFNQDFRLNSLSHVALSDSEGSLRQF